MGQILIIQDESQIGASLNADHSVVHATATEDLRRLLSMERFQAALVANPHTAEETLAVVREADADLSGIVLGNSSAPNIAEDAAWEVLPAPIPPGALRAAIKRAIHRSELAREIRTLRGQLQTSAPAPVQPGNGVSAEHLKWIATLPPRFDLRELLASVEKSVIQRMLEATRGAQAEAARRLGLSRSDLSYKLAKYELRKSGTAPSN